MLKEATHKYRVERTEVPLLKNFIEEHLRNWGVEEQCLQDIILAADEAATNIVEHGYKNIENKQNKVFTLTLKKEKNTVEVILEDEGQAFEPNKAPKPNIKLNLTGKRRGGFGVFLMNALMDKIKYSQRGGKNLMCMIKKIP